jgi:hypothetical protein
VKKSAPDEFSMRLDGLQRDPVLGEVTEDQIRTHWHRSLDLSDAVADELMDDFWRWYVGVLDEPLFDWFAARRPGWHAVLHESTPASIAGLERIIVAQGR